MKVDRKSMLLYVVTDRTWLGQNDFYTQVEETLKGGATFLQLREKDLPFEDFLKEAKNIKEIAKSYGVPFVINDNIEVAVSCGADGVHVGQEDLSAKEVRSLIGPDKILGVSAGTVAQALLAQKEGADYIGVGAVFATGTKKDAKTLPLETVKQICKAVTIPVVAIGGIGEENILRLKGSGVDGVAVISAIFASDDLFAATRRLKELSRQMVAL